jgi:hypothetical protein
MAVHEKRLKSNRVLKVLRLGYTAAEYNEWGFSVVSAKQFFKLDSLLGKVQ